MPLCLEHVVDDDSFVAAADEVGSNRGRIHIPEPELHLVVDARHDEVAQVVAVHAGAVAHAAGEDPPDGRLADAGHAVEDDYDAVAAPVGIWIRQVAFRSRGSIRVRRTAGSRESARSPPT